MSVSFQFNLVTPERSVLSQDEVIVTVPGAEGYFGVLPGHAPLVTLLKAGVLTVGEGKRTTRYALSGGYAEVSPDRTTILADQVLCWDTIDPERAEAERQEAVEHLAREEEEASSGHYWEKRRDFSDVCLALHQQYLSRD